ncbi:unnamed protein product [Rhizophagus irregularis]|nr:unnamed protein product [Rhizophagus irregularis]
MYGLDLIILQIGSLCTLYVIIRTFIRWFKQNYSLYMSHKLPFYMAFSEFFVYTALIINLYYPAINDKQWPEQSCKIMGLMFYFFAIFNMILVGSLALITYLRVCKAMNINTGILDYKLFIFPLIVPTILCIPAWEYFGPDGYWCFQNRASSFIPLVLLYMNISILMTSLFCYIGIAHAINVSRFRNDQENFRASNKKIISYLFMFILQWTPVMVFLIFDVNKEANMWIFVICFISLPAGGIINTYRYISNEGFWNTYSEFGTGRDPSSRNQSNLHSIKNYGGPPTVSQWRELSGGDDISNRSSILSEYTPQVTITNQSQDSLDQIQIQLQNCSQLSLDIIQPQPSSSYSQNSYNRSQDKINKIRSQSSLSSPSQSSSSKSPFSLSRNRSKDKINKIRSQSSSSSLSKRSQDKIVNIKSQLSSFLSQNGSQDKIDKFQSQSSSLSQNSQNSSNRSQDKIDKISQNRSQNKIYKFQSQSSPSLPQNLQNRSQDKIDIIKSQNRSQDKIYKIQSQSSSSLPQNLQNRSQDKIDNIKSQNRSQDKIYKIQSSSLSQNRSQDKISPQNESQDKIDTQSPSSLSQTLQNRSQDKINNIQLQSPSNESLSS